VTATGTAARSRVAPVAPPRAAPARRSVARVVLAVIGLLAIYGVLSLANDPHAFLGTDTGGKVATLRAMDARGDLDPDLGYWAERFDPDGLAHPIALNYHIAHRWVNVTTLPMIYAATPLYDLGGLRGILLIPMLGGCLSALAARALARRLATGNPDLTGWVAFWAVGLATPVAVYALDFWEHTIGLAAMLWGVVALLDVAKHAPSPASPPSLVDGASTVSSGEQAEPVSPASWRMAMLGGAAFGVAATTRTEALVYAAVTFVAVGVALLADRRRDVLRVAAGAAVGFTVPIALNHLLERAVLGQGLRASRASGAVSDGAGNAADRAGDALRTTVGLNHFGPPAVDWLLGALIVAFLALAICVLLRGRGPRPAVWFALACAALLYVLRFESGLGFVPGMLVASPLAVAGVVAGLDRRWSSRPACLVGAIALAALPLVWLYQYRGGANPQWGGRYILCSGVLLAVLGVVALVARGTRALVPALVAALLVTGCGLTWLAIRSHSVADSARVLETTDDPVLTIGLPHLLREWGAFYRPDRPLLTAERDSELPVALDVLEGVGASDVTVIARVPAEAPRRLGPFVRTGSAALAWTPGVDLVVARYHRP
jgi:hypothetical protein